MPSRDDKNPLFCSERMKICQKHLSNVYNRSKKLLVTARAGKVVPEVTSSAARGFANESGKNPRDGKGLSKFEKKNLSPYLCAVSGLFDGPSLLKQFQLKRLCGGLAEKKLKDSSKLDCPQFCHESTTKDPTSVPLFFKENIPVPNIPNTLDNKYSTKTAKVQGISKGKHEGDGYVEPPVSLKSQGNLSTPDLPQTSNVSTLSTVPEKKTRARQVIKGKNNPSLPKHYSIDDMGKWGIPTHSLSNTSFEHNKFSNLVFPQSSFPHSSTSPSFDSQHQRAITTTTSKNPPKRLLDTESQQSASSSGNGKKPPQLLLGIETPRRAIDTTCGKNPPSRKSGKKPPQPTIGPSINSEGPSKILGEESQQRQIPTNSQRPFANSLLDNDTQQKGVSTSVASPKGTFASRLKKVKQSTNVLQASVAKVFGTTMGPSQQVKQILTVSQLHDAICDHSTPDCPSFRRRDKLGAIQPLEELNMSQQVDATSPHDFAHNEIVSANDQVAQCAFEVKTDVRRQEKSSANLWKYGSMAICTENPGRDYTTGESPPDALEVLAKKKLEISGYHWSRSGSRKVVNYICQILKQNGWGSGVVELLDAVKGMVNTHCVNAILQQLKDPHLCLAFFKWGQKQKGYKHDVFAFTTMINILGRARNLRGVRHLLEDMHVGGIEPNVATYNTLLLCYGKVESLNESMRVFRIMQEAGCKPDNVTYSVLIHLCIKAGYLQEALKLYQGMLEAGVSPDTITYSIVIDSLGKSGNLREARKLFREMKERGCVPNEFTYNSLINRHAKVHKTHHAMKYYTEMRAAGFKLNVVTCTTMMGVLGSLGKFDQAEGLFAEMQQSGIVADTAAYSLMINIWGNSGNLDKAVSWYGRMLGNLVTPSLSVFNSLVNAHLEENLYQAAQHFLTSMVMWGINPDLKIYTMLLRHCTLCERQEHADLVLGIMDRLGHPAHRFLYELLTAVTQDSKSIRSRVTSYFDSIDQEDRESKQGFANALIEFLHKLQCKTDPGVVWETTMEKGIFPSSIVRREAPNHWLVDLHSLAVGTALVALPRLLVVLRDKWVQDPTKRVYIVTGWGKRSRVACTSALKQAVHDVLEATKSPFSLDHANAGVFVSYGPPFCDWMSEPSIMKKLAVIASEGVVK